MLVNGFSKSIADRIDIAELGDRIDLSIYENEYLKQAQIIPYDKQYLGLLYANMPNLDKLINQILLGAGGFGGKTYIGSMLGCEYLMSDETYTCLVTRLNHAELLDTNSIWDNLVEWCCNDSLPKDWQCDFKQSPMPVIESPVGNKIYFKAFDQAKKKQKLKSTSYDRIINDEASELPVEVLKFQYRSLRNTSNIPISLIHLSNPSSTNQEANQYLIDKFIDGIHPYIPMDWRDNPFIDKLAYENTLNELDYIDQQYQKYGNWHYKPTTGDLIAREHLENALTSPYYLNNYRVLFNGVGIDIAGTGRDRTCPASIVLLENGKKMLVDLTADGSSYPEQTVHDFAEKQISHYNTNAIKFEQEAGSDWLYSLRYWRNELSDITLPAGVIVDTISTGAKSKFNRARPVARAIRNGELLISDSIDRDVLDRLFDQFIYISPVPAEMQKMKSPDELDAVVYAYMIVQEMLDSYVTAY